MRDEPTGLPRLRRRPVTRAAADGVDAHRRRPARGGPAADRARPHLAALVTDRGRRTRGLRAPRHGAHVRLLVAPGLARRGAVADVPETTAHRPTPTAPSTTAPRYRRARPASAPPAAGRRPALLRRPLRARRRGHARLLGRHREEPGREGAGQAADGAGGRRQPSRSPPRTRVRRARDERRHCGSPSAARTCRRTCRHRATGWRTCAAASPAAAGRPGAATLAMALVAGGVPPVRRAPGPGTHARPGATADLPAKPRRHGRGPRSSSPRRRASTPAATWCPARRRDVPRLPVRAETSTRPRARDPTWTLQTDELRAASTGWPTTCGGSPRRPPAGAHATCPAVARSAPRGLPDRPAVRRGGTVWVATPGDGECGSPPTATSSATAGRRPGAASPGRAVPGCPRARPPRPTRSPTRAAPARRPAGTARTTCSCRRRRWSCWSAGRSTRPDSQPRVQHRDAARRCRRVRGAAQLRPWTSAHLRLLPRPRDVSAQLHAALPVRRRPAGARLRRDRLRAPRGRAPLHRRRAPGHGPRGAARRRRRRRVILAGWPQRLQSAIMERAAIRGGGWREEAGMTRSRHGTRRLSAAARSTTRRGSTTCSAPITAPSSRSPGAASPSMLTTSSGRCSRWPGGAATRSPQSRSRGCTERPGTTSSTRAVVTPGDSGPCRRPRGRAASISSRRIPASGWSRRSTASR